MKILPTELYIYTRVKDQSITQPRVYNPCVTLPPSERRDLRGVGTVYGRTLTYPLRFNYLGNQGDVFFGTHTQAFL